MTKTSGKPVSAHCGSPNDGILIVLGVGVAPAALHGRQGHGQWADMCGKGKNVIVR